MSTPESIWKGPQSMRTMRTLLLTACIAGIVAPVLAADSQDIEQQKKNDGVYEQGGGFGWNPDFDPGLILTDPCTDAPVVTCGGLYSGTTVDGVDLGYRNTGNDALVKVTIPTSGNNVTMDICNDVTWDTYMYLYAGPDCPVWGDAYLDYSDDEGCGAMSTIIVDNMDAGDYWLVITGYSTTGAGAFDLTVTCEVPPPPPSNNEMADATPMLVGECVTGNTCTAGYTDTTLGYADTTGLFCTWKNDCSTYYSAASSGLSKDAWYTITVDAGQYSIDLLGSSYDTVLGVFDASGTLVAGNDDYICPSYSSKSKVECCDLLAGTYYIAVDGYGSSACGDFVLCVEACATADATELPSAFALGQNYPNPFNPTTTIEFSLESAGTATLAIFDLAGRKVATLVDGMTERGSHSVSFDAGELTSGVYFYTLAVDGLSQTRKMVLVK